MTEKGYKLASCVDTQQGGNHYKDRGIQPIEFAQANNLDWKQFNVVKYVTRHRDKKGAEDLRKAIHYLQMALEFDYGLRSVIEYDEGYDVVVMDVNLKFKQGFNDAKWYPDNSGEWIEYKAQSDAWSPVGDRQKVEVLTAQERTSQKYDQQISESFSYDWGARNGTDEIVAYKIVK